jgi:fructose/tagatose bisphosphate aldolase
MPLIVDRQAVLDVYAAAAERKWTVPAFGTENRTTTEAVLAAAKEYGDAIGREDIPVTVAVTNLYEGRSQSTRYTHTRQWDVGLRLLLADLEVLTSPSSPFGNLDVMVHLDHIQPDLDRELLDWDMGMFSSIMFDASKAPMDENMEMTRRFVETRGDRIVVEGACDEIVEAGNDVEGRLTTPDRAAEYLGRTGVDFVVANLGTEHRAAQSELRYRADLARAVRDRIGTRIVLHGTSSVPAADIAALFDDGICKVNIWTRLERDSAGVLFENLLENAARVTGPERDIAYYTASYRRQLVFERMKEIVTEYLAMWYRQGGDS